jgi:hypothetical protein
MAPQGSYSGATHFQPVLEPDPCKPSALHLPGKLDLKKEVLKANENCALSIPPSLFVPRATPVAHPQNDGEGKDYWKFPATAREGE